MKNHLICLIAIVATMSACQDDDGITGQDISNVLSALPETVNHPADNPYSLEKENLGRMLFWDPVLSGTKEVSCASCHHPDLGYADGLLFSQGVGGTGLGPDRTGGMRTRRNAPTVINAAFNGIDNDGLHNPSTAPMFWDNRAMSLENQALLPMLSKEEMRGNAIQEAHIMDTITQRLANIPEYQSLFSAAFGPSSINQGNILKAIATFERGIIANNSRFDQYMRGDETAMTNLEIQGMNAFVEVGCADCHNGPMFSDYELHTIGVPDNTSPPDNGASGSFDFRTPTLRNLSLTGPYMHNGIHSTLEELMDFYEEAAEGDGLNANVTQNQLDEDMRDLDLDDNQIDAIIHFLGTLDDDNFDKTIPSSVPSNLPVGGNIN